jgi:hypothetical protein
MRHVVSSSRAHPSLPASILAHSCHRPSLPDRRPEEVFHTMQRARAWAGHRTRTRPWSAWRSCLSVCDFLTANGFEMARLLGREWIGWTYLVRWCIDHIGWCCEVRYRGRTRREQQEQKDLRFLLLHVLTRDDVCFYLQIHVAWHSIPWSFQRPARTRTSLARIQPPAIRTGA